MAAAVFLLMLPLAILSQVIFGYGAEIIIHFTGALGFLLISWAVFDFRLPGWINRWGWAVAAVLAFTFLLQGISNLVENDTLFYFAFQILGQQLEGWLIRTLVFWFSILLVMDSQGKTKVLGLVVILIVVGMEVYSFTGYFLGISVNREFPALKILYLLIFVWFFFESKKNLPQNAQI